MDYSKFGGCVFAVAILALSVGAQRRQQFFRDDSHHQAAPKINLKDQSVNSTRTLYLSKTVKNHEDDDPTLKSGMGRRRDAPDTKKTSCVFGLCEDVENYPEAHISNLINQTDVYEDYFKNIIPTIDLGSRYNLDDNEETLCNTKTITVFPQKANNTKRVERTIVNVKDKYMQGIKSETCLGDGSKCKFSDMFPTGYSASCKQKFVTRKLMIYNEDDDKKIAFDTFDVPSCCVCVVKRTT